MTTIKSVTPETIGMTQDQIDDLKHFMVVERISTAKSFLTKWLSIGDICLRLKALDGEDKFSDRVNMFFGTVLSNDERQYSMKLFDDEKSVTKWYNDKGCMKYNPRTIWTAYKADTDPAPKKKTTKKKQNGDVPSEGTKELRKERKSSDVLKSYTEFRRIFDNAVENGNMELSDYEMLIQGLTATLEEVTQMAEFEANATNKVVNVEPKKKAS